MTWNGTQGFQSPIGEDNFLVDNLGAAGHMHTERGLACEFIFLPALSALSINGFSEDVEFYYSGHMTPRKCYSR